MDKNLEKFINETFYDLLITEHTSKEQMLDEFKLIFDSLLITYAE